MKQRTPIPKPTGDLVLTANAHTCCRCHDPRKHVILHHIDHNPSNHDPENLACLCHDCHSYIHSDGGLGRRVSPSELHLMKTNWEGTCKEMTPGELAQRFRKLMLNPDGTYRYCPECGAKVAITDSKVSYVDPRSSEVGMDYFYQCTSCDWYYSEG